MGYTIRKYSYDRARKLGVTIRRSTNPKKKLDVFSKTGKKLASIGAVGYDDFPTFMSKNPELAKRRRRSYKIRHQKDRHKRGTAGYYADKILW